MSIAIIPDTLTVTSADDDIHRAVVGHIVRGSVDLIIRVHTAEHPDGIDLTVLAHQPDHAPDHLYGAALYGEDRHLHGDDPFPADLPADPFPVIAFDRITGIHIY